MTTIHSKTAGVVIDTWKLPIFKRHLEAARYEYTEHPGLTSGLRTLQVKYQWVHELQPIIQAANEECAQVKARGADSISGDAT